MAYDNNELRRYIGELNRKIDEVERKIREYEGRLDAIRDEASNDISRLNATANNINATMLKDSNDLEYSDNTFKQVIQTKAQIRELLLIFEEVQTAAKRIRDLSNKLYFEFYNQARVRKIARAFVDNLDLEMVSDELIYQSIEKQHLQAPDYWLTFALLAIMAWRNDDQVTCQAALEGALSLDERSTITFMTLFHLRMRRFDVALKWFNCLSDMEALGKDSYTYLMLISIIPFKVDEIESHEGKEYEFPKVVYSHLLEKYKECSSEQQDAQFRNFILTYFQRLDVPETLQYPYFTRFVNVYQNMANALSSAKNNQAILDYLEDISHVHLRENNPILNKSFDRLFETPSKGEEAIIRQIKDLEDIVSALPELKKELKNITKEEFHQYAIHKADEKKKHDASVLNLPYEMMNWFFYNPDPDINSLTRWNIFCLLIDNTKKAYIQYYYRYHNLLPKTFPIDIDDFATQTEFKDKEADKRAVDTFIDNKKAYLLKKAIKPLFYIGIVLFAGLIALGVFALQKEVLPGAIASFAGSGLSALMAVFALLANIKKKKGIVEKAERDRVEYKEIIDHLYEEKAKYDAEFSEADAISQDVNLYFEKHKK